LLIIKCLFFYLPHLNIIIKISMIKLITKVYKTPHFPIISPVRAYLSFYNFALAKTTLKNNTFNKNKKE